MDFAFFLPSVSLFAILVAALGASILGAIWHSPKVLGSLWEKLMELTPEQVAANKAKKMAPIIAIHFITDAVSAFVIITLANLLILTTNSDIIQIALLVWLGGIVPMAVASVLWENKSWKLAVFNSAYRLVSFVLMGAIIAWLG